MRGSIYGNSTHAKYVRSSNGGREERENIKRERANPMVDDLTYFAYVGFPRAAPHACPVELHPGAEKALGS